MSTPSTHVAGGQGTSPGLEAVLNDSARLVEALESARKTRRLLLLGVLAFLVATGVMFYRLISRISSEDNINQLTSLAKDRLAANSDEYMNEVRQLVDTSTPILTDAFYKRAKDDLPHLVRAAGVEREKLVANLLDQVEGKLSDHYRSVLDRHESILQEELPATKDPELRRRLETNLGVAFDRLVKKYYADEINGQVTALLDAWEQFPEATSSPDDAPLGDQLVGNMFELLKLKLIEGEVGFVPGAEGLPATIPNVAAPTAAPGASPRPPDRVDPQAPPALEEPKPDQPKADEPKADEKP